MNPKDARRTAYFTCPHCREQIKLTVEQNPRKKVIDWDGVDFPRRTTIQIADDLGVSRATVSSARRKLAPETLGKLQSQQKYDWHVVDWRLGNQQISAAIGAPESYISLMRRRHAPGTVRTRKR